MTDGLGFLNTALVAFRRDAQPLRATAKILSFATDKLGTLVRRGQLSEIHNL